MLVDFEFAKSPKLSLASIRWVGPWSDAKIHANFLQVAKWTRANGLRTGRWVFTEPAERTWEVGIEIRGRAPSDRKIRVRTLPATAVARVVFDPDVVSPRVVYHGLADWLRSRKKDGEVQRVGAYREVYPGDPWADRRALAHTEIQVAVRRR